MTNKPHSPAEEGEESKVWCDGGNQSSGHPRIYLQINPYQEFVICPYCSKKFVLKR